MKQSKTSKFAYLAGVIDGDGTIGIYRKGDVDKNYPGQGRGLSLYVLTIAVGQKRGPIIDWLYGNFGGKIYTKTQVTSVPNSKKIYNHQMYEWKLNKLEDIEYVLKRILPFLHEKKDQAELALQFINKRIQVNKTGIKNGFIVKYPEDVMANWIEFAAQKSNELKHLKRKFVPCAAVETKFLEPSIDGKL